MCAQSRSAVRHLKTRSSLVRTAVSPQAVMLSFSIRTWLHSCFTNKQEEITTQLIPTQFAAFAARDEAHRSEAAEAEAIA